MNSLKPLLLALTLTLVSQTTAKPCTNRSLEPLLCGCALISKPFKTLAATISNPCGALPRRRDPCRAYRGPSGINLASLTYAIRTQQCFHTPRTVRMLRTLSPEEEAAIIERIRDMVLMVLAQLNMGRSIEPGFRMVLQLDHRNDALKTARLVAYNNFHV